MTENEHVPLPSATEQQEQSLGALGRDTWGTLQTLRKRTPLVHCMTNLVATNFAANAVIAAGGSPVATIAEPSEAAAFASVAHAVTVSLAIVAPTELESVRRSVAVAHQRGVPWVLDPVGAAASEKRRQRAHDLINESYPTVVRGNASEIAALAQPYVEKEAGSTGGASVEAKGLDSRISAAVTLPAAKIMARATRTIVAISGAIDYVTDGVRTARIVNGHPMMAQATATGCSLTCVLGSFVAAAANTRDAADLFWATVHGMSYYAVAGQLAATVGGAKGTGGIHSGLLDYLSSMTEEQYRSVARPPLDLSLYLVTDPHLNLGRDDVSIVEAAIKGGVSVVQLREKDIDTGPFYAKALAVKQVCDKYGVPLLIDDRIDIALAVDAAGVHIGQTDMPFTVARRLLGPTKIVGLTINSHANITKGTTQTSADYESDVDYIGISPVYPTKTKEGQDTNALSPEGLAKLASLAASHGLALSVGIGGIKHTNAAAVREIGNVDGVAVVTAVTMAEDPESAARELLPLP